MKKMLLAVSYGPVMAGLLALGTTGFSSCKKKEEEPPPVPSAPPAPTPAPTPVVVIAPEEDAGIAEIVDAAPDAKKVVVGVSPDLLGLQKCCAALQQNAQSLDPATKSYGLAAAAACQQMVAALRAGGTTKASAFGQLAAITKNLPPACR